ncbi:ABC transporter permease [Agrobacterium rhizogenes]|uniref:Oligopeptide ABC transporter (Permease) n=1 Tax=Rhizobium rhizogenes (strain K84 / ATCC BAA-868) TaxID=311403 RepID=B9JQC1_RHIR8|nr:ABC transporter permease [Rhizobium rhizogenes]ACM31340.1 oligopeptide ABC transporter (permease) [Rhizobium rhizogenes K84]OCJ22064.1 peptide ABC transporter permease [Agrobacterium sp. B131/95]OCJ24419.1 peptide ABC transporter permease [Agrobacterium sp. B133/95]NTI46288.1 ABC transporter permease [Rhizobium rhizogenes]NTI52971.1 ABC transporter permease [Rhizobium rhizogenes]
MTLQDTAGLETTPGRIVAGLRSLLTSRSGCVGVLILGIIVLAALFADYLPLPSPRQRNLNLKFAPPIWAAGGLSGYWLGTDGQGRDVLARVIYGARTSLIVGLAAVAFSGIVGLVLGLVAGYRGGLLDAVLMRVIDAMLAIPTMLFMLVVALVAGSGMLPLVSVIAVTNWVVYARLVRAEVLHIKELEFVSAARIGGVCQVRILLRHILPNTISAFIVIATLNIGSVILAESSLSFLGFGIQPPEVSWGQMLSDGRQSLATSWWVATFPGVALTLTVFSIILIGDWLRDYLDPRMP